MKNPFICIIVFIISVVMLGYAYYLVTSGLKVLTSDISILYLLFRLCFYFFYFLVFIWFNFKDCNEL